LLIREEGFFRTEESAVLISGKEDWVFSPGKTNPSSSQKEKKEA